MTFRTIEKRTALLLIVARFLFNVSYNIMYLGNLDKITMLIKYVLVINFSIPIYDILYTNF